jgi:hypothetical protein
MHISTLAVVVALILLTGCACAGTTSATPQAQNGWDPGDHSWVYGVCATFNRPSGATEGQYGNEQSCTCALNLFQKQYPTKQNGYEFAHPTAYNGLDYEPYVVAAMRQANTTCGTHYITAT